MFILKTASLLFIYLFRIFIEVYLSQLMTYAKEQDLKCTLFFFKLQDISSE